MNLFAPQILVGLIGPGLGMTAPQAGMISTMTLLGYALGLFLLVPLADLFENKRLILRTLCCAVLAAVCTALAPTLLLLLLLLLLLHLRSRLIMRGHPDAGSAGSVDDSAATSRQVIGEVMSGLMIGILLSRPLASLIADAWSWRAFYLISAVSMAALTGAPARYLPTLRPAARANYRMLPASFPKLLKDASFARSLLTAALVMASFTAYWSAIALRLTTAPLNLNAQEVAAFALIGAAGAAGTPWAGRLGDRGWARPLLATAHILIIGSLALCAWAAIIESHAIALLVLGVGAVLLDVGVASDQTLGRRAINLLQPEARGRLNGLFVGLFFIGGALGAAAAAFAWTFVGWTAVCFVAGFFGLVALITDIATSTGTS